MFTITLNSHSIPNYLLNDQLMVFSTKTVFAQKHALSHSIKSDLNPTSCFNTLLLNDANLRAFFPVVIAIWDVD